jgi:hypothetical protein
MLSRERLAQNVSRNFRFSRFIRRRVRFFEKIKAQEKTEAKRSTIRTNLTTAVAWPTRDHTSVFATGMSGTNPPGIPPWTPLLF